MRRPRSGPRHASSSLRANRTRSTERSIVTPRALEQAPRIQHVHAGARRSAAAATTGLGPRATTAGAVHEARGCGRPGRPKRAAVVGVARQHQQVLGAPIPRRRARSSARGRRAPSSASPWWFMTPPTAMRQHRHRGDAARPRSPRPRQRSAARTARPPTSKASSRSARLARAALTTRSSAPVRKRRVELPQLAATVASSPRRTRPSPPSTSIWRRDGRRRPRATEAVVRARDSSRSRPSTSPCARRRAPGCRPPGRSPPRAPRPRPPRRGSARARCAIVFTSSRPSPITWPDSRISSATLRVSVSISWISFDDLVGAARRALGELADLVGHDREAAPGLARARGLDRGVQREQVRARRDAGDDLGDLVDVARLGLELEDHAARLLDALEHAAHLLDREPRDVDARVRLLVRLGGEAEGLARARRGELDGRRDVAGPGAAPRRGRSCWCAPRATSPTVAEISSRRRVAPRPRPCERASLRFEMWSALWRVWATSPRKLVEQRGRCAARSPWSRRAKSGVRGARRRARDRLGRCARSWRAAAGSCRAISRESRRRRGRQPAASATKGREPGGYRHAGALDQVGDDHHHRRRRRASPG